MTLRVAVLVSGRGSNLASLLEHIRKGSVQAKVTLVVSDKPGAEALDSARHHGVPAVVTLAPEPDEKSSSYNDRLLAVLRGDKPDLVVLAGYMRILGKAVVDAFPGRVVNIHPSLLPAFKGLRAVQQALDAGVRFAGCSTHLVTADLDGGPIVLQAAVAVKPDDTHETLSRRILRLEHLLLPRTVQLFCEGRVATADGRAIIAPGPSWLQRTDLDLPSGVLYGHGF
ncbi:MAG: phosphoribosylglycinamide formyltransferase [Candidatus Thermoplasmatota archaeon]